MKIVLTTIMATVSLWALTATVKNGEVTVKIGNTTKTYQKGATFPVAYNEKICLSPNSKGIVKLDEEQGQITVDTCITPEKRVRTASEPSMFVKVLNLFSKSKESEKDGVGVKGYGRENNLIMELNKIKKDKSFNNLIINNAKKSYIIGENIEFTIDTNNLEGYLTLIYLEKENATFFISTKIKGIYSFPKDFGNFTIEAYKRCNHCDHEKTSIFMILAPNKLSNKKNITHERLLNISNQVLIGNYDFYVY